MNIEEIKARAGKKLAGRNKFHGYIATRSSKHGEGVYDAIINRIYQCEYEDIPALIAEVERLEKIVKLQKASCSLVETVEAGKTADENNALKKENATLKSERDDYIKIGEDYRKKLLASEAENATLKKALMQAIREGHTDLSSTSHQKLFYRYIQAQQTHEMQEAEK